MNSTAPICCTLPCAGPSHGSETDGTKNSTEPFADDVMLFPRGKKLIIDAVVRVAVLVSLGGIVDARVIVQSNQPYPPIDGVRE